MDDDFALEKGVAFIVVLAALVGLLVWAITFRRTDDILVHDRYWRYELAVRHDKTDVHIQTRLVDDCYGSEENRHCTSRTESYPVTETHTYTRCRDELVGRELPPVRPQVPCQMWPGDYIQEGVSYRLVFSIKGKEGNMDRGFDAALWDKLGPGSMRHVTRNILGDVVAVGGE